MTLHRIVRFIAERFAYWVLALLVVEGVLAFVMMCVFPPGSLAMVFLGLITLLLAAPATRLLDWMAAMLRRRLVHRGLIAAGEGAPASVGPSSNDE